MPSGVYVRTPEIRAKQSAALTGRTRGKPRHARTYISWANMNQRCRNPNNPNYTDYGAQGIRVCDRWNPKAGGHFVNFLADMGERPEGTTLDRYPDPDGDYTPENCRWATPKEQRANYSRFRPSRSGWISDPQ